MEVNITEEKFKAYRELQNSGEINMLDYINLLVLVKKSILILSIIIIHIEKNLMFN